MELDYRIVDHHDAENAYVAIQNGLNDYAAEFNIPARGFVNFICYEAGRVVGGAVANTVASRMNVKWLWVDPSYRGRQIGKKLMEGMEAIALEKGIDRIFVDTMSYQAPEFYAKVGFQEVARIYEFYPGFDRIFYEKGIVV